MKQNQIQSALVILNMTEVVRRAIDKTSSPELSRVINGNDIELSSEALAAQAIRSNLQEK
jgi:hypothetical protein